MWGVERRLFFLAMLMGAATFNLFYSFLAGLLMFGTLYGFAWWATDRDPDMLRILLSSSRARRRFDPGEARAARPRGAAMMRVGRILRDYSEAGAINSLIALWGFVDDTHVPDEERARRRGLPPARPGRRGPDPRPAASRWFTSSKPPCGCWMSAAASTSTSSSRHVDPFVAPACPRAVAQEALSAPRRLPERAT